MFVFIFLVLLLLSWLIGVLLRQKHYEAAFSLFLILAAIFVVSCVAWQPHHNTAGFKDPEYVELLIRWVAAIFLGIIPGWVLGPKPEKT